MQNIDLNNEYSSAQHHNKHEVFLGQQNVDDEGCDNVIYNNSLNNFKILTSIYQNSIINSNIRSLNQKPREVYDIAHKRVRDHKTYLSSAIKKKHRLSTC